jgi:hypothetical protein
MRYLEVDSKYIEIIIISMLNVSMYVNVESTLINNIILTIKSQYQIILTDGILRDLIRYSRTPIFDMVLKNIDTIDLHTPIDIFIPEVYNKLIGCGIGKEYLVMKVYVSENTDTIKQNEEFV